MRIGRRWPGNLVLAGLWLDDARHAGLGRRHHRQRHVDPEDRSWDHKGLILAGILVPLVVGAVPVFVIANRLNPNRPEHKK